MANLATINSYNVSHTNKKRAKTKHCGKSQSNKTRQCNKQITDQNNKIPTIQSAKITISSRKLVYMEIFYYTSLQEA